jgi:hypothetical protein
MLFTNMGPAKDHVAIICRWVEVHDTQDRWAPTRAPGITPAVLPGTKPTLLLVAAVLHSDAHLADTVLLGVPDAIRPLPLLHGGLPVWVRALQCGTNTHHGMVRADTQLSNNR